MPYQQEISLYIFKTSCVLEEVEVPEIEMQLSEAKNISKKGIYKIDINKLTINLRELVIKFEIGLYLLIVKKL